MSTNNDETVRGSGALALTIAYHGGRFAGSQRQGALRTVQSELDRALARFWGPAVATVFAGRTDRGVHAAGQVVSVRDGRPDLAVDQIAKAINVRLPDDLAVVCVERRPEGFHARYDARWREYRYCLWCGPNQPLVAGLVAQRGGSIAVEPMQAAASVLIGEQDLAAFAGDGEGVPWSERQRARRGTVRTVTRCAVSELSPWWTGLRDTGTLVEIRVVADGFLPKMVRNIVGALIEVGSGRKPATWFGAVLAGRDRRLAGMTAPAHGLTLWRVGYDGDVPDSERDEIAR